MYILNLNLNTRKNQESSIMARYKRRRSYRRPVRRKKKSSCPPCPPCKSKAGIRHRQSRVNRRHASDRGRPTTRRRVGSSHQYSRGGRGRGSESTGSTLYSGAKHVTSNPLFRKYARKAVAHTKKHYKGSGLDTIADVAQHTLGL